MSEFSFQVLLSVFSFLALCLTGLITWIFLSFRAEVMTEMALQRAANHDLRNAVNNLSLKVAAEYVRTTSFEAALDRIDNKLVDISAMLRKAAEEMGKTVKREECLALHQQHVGVVRGPNS